MTLVLKPVQLVLYLNHRLHKSVPCELCSDLLPNITEVKEEEEEPSVSHDCSISSDLLGSTISCKFYSSHYIRDQLIP